MKNINFKIIKIIAAAVMILVQLFVIGYSFVSNYVIAATGKEYKFRVEPVDPYDIFRGRYVNFRVSGDVGVDNNDYFIGGVYVSEERRYALIETESDGFSKITGYVAEKPKTDDYVYVPKGSVRIADRYYMDEDLAPEAEKQIPWGAQIDDVYVIVRVKNGKAVTTGLYAGGMKIEDFVTRRLSFAPQT